VDRGDLVEVDVDAELVNTACTDVVNATVRLIQECLGDAPPDLSQDVSARGMVLTGGNALLSDLAELIATSTGVDVTVAPQPDTVVIQGLQLCLEEMSSLHALYRDADR
jgi:rod shape-determining protein MreB